MWASGLLCEEANSSHLRKYLKSESRNQQTEQQPSTRSWQVGQSISSTGHVVKGLNLETGSLLAIKTIEGPSFRQVRHFSRLAHQVVHHRSLVQVLEVQYHHEQPEKRLHIVTEYLPFGNLAQLLAQFGALEEQVVRHFCAQILDALLHLHQHEMALALEDFSTASILVAQDRQVKVSVLKSVSIIPNDEYGTLHQNAFTSASSAFGPEFEHLVRQMITGGNVTHHHTELRCSQMCSDFLHQCHHFASGLSSIERLCQHPFIATTPPLSI